MAKWVFLLCIIVSCSKDSDPESDQGCLTGIRKGSNYRVTIRCSTKPEFLAGSNVNAGGTSNWNDYEQHKWAPCPDCN